LEAAKDVIFGMTANPHLYHVSPHLEYLLNVCGGVGGYLEIAIIQISRIRSAKTDVAIFIVLDKVTTCVLSHYPKVFSRFANSIEVHSFPVGHINMLSVVI
jgi:hypothetical protein